MMKWFLWDQNNSGGSFVEDEHLTTRVFIQAETGAKAEAKAFDFGVYYNGVEDGLDCDCCGDRWYSPEEVSLPKAETIEEYAQYLVDNYGWCSPDARLFYADGSVKEIF
jgi:hypothetical protein